VSIKLTLRSQVFVLWPDDGTWYRGTVRRCDPQKYQALIFYEDTEEEEKANLRELISKGEIAFSKQAHTFSTVSVCVAGEFPLCLVVSYFVIVDVFIHCRGNTARRPCMPFKRSRIDRNVLREGAARGGAIFGRRS